jgi:hypothetical protein
LFARLRSLNEPADRIEAEPPERDVLPDQAQVAEDQVPLGG